MAFLQKTIGDLLTELAELGGDADVLINNAESDSERGHVFEALCYGAIALGCSPFGAVTMLDGSVNRRADLMPFASRADCFARKIRNGAASGYSDIHFLDEADGAGALYLTSCKWFSETRAIGVDDYDLPLLMFANTGNELGATRYVLFVRDRASYESVVERAHSKRELYRSLNVIVLDFVTDLCGPMMARFRQAFPNGAAFRAWLAAAADAAAGAGRIPILPKVHQVYTLLRTTEIQTGATAGLGDVLWNLKSRSGKSYAMALHVVARMRALAATGAPPAFLFITTYPRETLTAIEQMFQRHTEFDGMRVVVLGRDAAPAPIAGAPTMFLASKQYLQKKDLAALKACALDTVYFDENHEGGCTQLAHEILALYAPRFRVFLTATGAKTRFVWGISSDRVVTWDLADEHMCREGDVGGLLARHGPLFKTAMETVFGGAGAGGAAALAAAYAGCPRIKILTHAVNPNYVQRFLAADADARGDYGYDMEGLFHVAAGAKAFTNERRVYEFVERCVFGRVPDRSVMRRLAEMSEGGALPTPHTQLWFLPYGKTGVLIGDVATNLKRVLKSIPSIANAYDVMVLGAAGCGTSASGGLIHSIERAERAAYAQGRGLILLSGNQASTGITLPFTDVVMMMNNESSSSRVFQRYMRVGTERAGKAAGYVVDFNVGRVVQTVLTQVAVSGPGLAETASVRERLAYASRIIDFADIEMSAATREDITAYMVRQWSRDTSMRFNAFSDLLNDLDITACLTTEQLLEWHAAVGRVSVGDTKRIYTSDEETAYEYNDAEHKLPVPVIAAAEAVAEAVVETVAETVAETVVEPVAETAAEAAAETVAEDESSVRERLSGGLNQILRGVVPSLMYLVAFITTDEPTVVDPAALLRRVQTDPELNAIVLSQMRAWWPDIRSPQKMMDLCEIVIVRHIRDLADLVAAVAMIKENFTELLRTEAKQDVLEFLNSMLKPKEAEKKQFGEVFTPLTLVNEMLDKLPPEVWSDPARTWFDPAAGIGNFPVCIYYRLMEGLADVFPDAEARAAHIVGRMLYMAELNPKNALMLRRIFGPEASIFRGDSLNFCPEGEEFGIAQFDIVLGNPPYNDASGNRGKGHALWPQFVEKALDEWLKPGGYLCMVHPGLWRQVNHDLLGKIKEYQMLYLEIHSEKDGLRTFACNTRYDWYVLRRVPADAGGFTMIKDQSGAFHEIALREWPFIPNIFYDGLKDLIAADGAPRCDIINNASYRTHNGCTSKKKDDTYKYPVINNVYQDDTFGLIWSNTQEKGHYNIPKVIIRAATPIIGFVRDPSGQYAMSQWCIGICATPQDHAAIVEKLRGAGFKKFVTATALRNEISVPIMRLLKRDFWKLL